MRQRPEFPLQKLDLEQHKKVAMLEARCSSRNICGNTPTAFYHSVMNRNRFYIIGDAKIFQII